MSELGNMTLAEAAVVLRQRIDHHRRVEENARIDRQRDEAALAVIEGLMRDGQAQPAPPASDDSPALLGIAAVREVMRANPTHEWSPREVHEILERRGWVSKDAQHPRAGTESAINRLLAKGEIEKVARGRYRSRGEQEALTES